jgi:protein CMS1
MMRPGGDDLDDDFVPDELVALSDGDEPADDAQGSLSVDEEVVDDPEGEDKNKSDKEKKRKRREKGKERKAKKRKLVESSDTVEPASITAQSPATLQSYLSAKQAKTFSTMSALELEDMQIPEASIADTTRWTGPRTLDQLVDFIVKVLPTLRTRLSQKSRSKGAPTLIFVTGAALRVADVTRVLKDKRLRGEKGGEVAKLFAKHFKLEEHVTYLKRTKVGVAVGTPGRIGKLLCETDALTLSALTHIMLDVTFRDAKKRTLLDIPETRDEVFKTVLGGSSVREAIMQGKIQVVLF